MLVKIIVTLPNGDPEKIYIDEAYFDAVVKYLSNQNISHNFVSIEKYYNVGVPIDLPSSSGIISQIVKYRFQQRPDFIKMTYSCGELEAKECPYNNDAPSCRLCPMPKAGIDRIKEICR